MNPTTTAHRSAHRWGWAILAITGATSLTFNIAHALAAAAKSDLHPALAVLYGVAPVAVALMLSHLIAIQRGGVVKRLLTGAVFAAGLGLSITAISEVLWPVAGHGSYVFAGMLDVAALMGLAEVLATEKTGTGQETAPAEPPLTEPGTYSGTPTRPAALGHRGEPAPVPAPGPQPVPEPADAPQEPAAAAAPEQHGAEPAPYPDTPRRPEQQPVPDAQNGAPENASEDDGEVDTVPMPRLVVPRSPGTPRRRTGTDDDLTALMTRAEREFAGDLADGRTPSIRAIKGRLRVGQTRAAQVQQYLRGRLGGTGQVLQTA